MPTITASDALAGKLKGMGMQVKVDPSTLKRLDGMRPNDVLIMTYQVTMEGGEGIAGGTAKAELTVKMDDPAGLFEGHSLVAVMGKLVADIVEARLTGTPVK